MIVRQQVFERANDTVAVALDPQTTVHAKGLPSTLVVLVARADEVPETGEELFFADAVVGTVNVKVCSSAVALAVTESGAGE